MNRTRRTTLGAFIWIGAAGLVAVGCGRSEREASAADGEAHGERTASGELTKPLPAESTTQATVAAPSTAAEATPGTSRSAADTVASGRSAAESSATPAALQPASETGVKQGTTKPKPTRPK